MHISEFVPMGEFYAWIDEQGNVHNVGDAYRHLEYLRTLDDAGIRDAVVKCDLELENNEEEREEHLNRCIANDEHPGMHVFCNQDADTRDELYMYMYNRGWMRFGVHSWTYGKRRNFALEVYGTQEAYDKIRKYLRMLKKDLDVRDNKAYAHIIREDTKCWRTKFTYKVEKI